jgi:hypothetical protein
MYEAVRNKDCNASWWRISVRVEHRMVGRHHLPTIKRAYETRNNRRNDPDEAIEPFFLELSISVLRWYPKPGW